MATMRKRGEGKKTVDAPAPPPPGAPPSRPTPARAAAPAGLLASSIHELARRVATTRRSAAATLAGLDDERVKAIAQHEARMKAIEEKPTSIVTAEYQYNGALGRIVGIDSGRVQRYLQEGITDGTSRPAPDLSVALRQHADAAEAIIVTNSMFKRLGAPAKLRAVAATFVVVERSWNEKMEREGTAEFERVRKQVGEIDGRILHTETALDTELARLSREWATLGSSIAGHHPSWDAPAWRSYAVPDSLPREVRVGASLFESPRASAAAPTLWQFPRGRSLVITADNRRMEHLAPSMLSMVLRLVAAMPRGAVEVRFLDPVGLGNNVAPLMQLREYDATIVNPTIAVGEADITAALNELVSHIGNVNASYLKGKYAAIEEHNEEAGEVAVPYKLVVAVGYPTNFNERAVSALCDIAESGAKAGVYTVVLEDPTRSLPYGANDSRLKAASHWIRPQPVPNFAPNGRYAGDTVALAETVPGSDPVRFAFDNPLELKLLDRPEATVFGILVDAIGTAARASRVRIVSVGELWDKFRDAVERNPSLYDGTPKAPRLDDRSTWWKASSQHGVDVPIGQVGATKIQRFRVVEHQHAHSLIVGGTGTGKTTLIHAIIAALTATYGPRELELTLIDMKDGVGFKIYASKGPLPHARTIAIKSDRSVALDVLQSLVQEMRRRNELFTTETRRVGATVDDLKTYRQSSGVVLPRHFCIMDEFQDLTGVEDSIGEQAKGLLKILAKEGRNAGIHLLLSTQNIDGSGLSSEIRSEIAVRICFRVNDPMASERVLGDGNYAAVEDLPASEAGVAIYNVDRSRAGNEIFKAAFIRKEDEVPALVGRLAELARSDGFVPRLRVFDGANPTYLDADPVVLGLFGLDQHVSTPAPPPAVTTTTGPTRRTRPEAAAAADSTPVVKTNMGRRRKESAPDETTEPTTRAASDPPTSPPPGPAAEGPSVILEEPGIRLEAPTLRADGSFEISVPAEFVDSITAPSRSTGPAVPPPIVGRTARDPGRIAAVTTGYVGQPLRLGASQTVEFRRTMGANMIIVGPSPTHATGELSGIICGFLAAALGQHEARRPVVSLLDFEPEVATSAYWRAVADASDGLVAYFDSTASELQLRRLAVEVEERRAQRRSGPFVPHLVLAYGAHQAHVLRSTSPDDEAVNTAFDTIVRDGPPFGVHNVIWLDSRRAVNSILGHSRLDEFALRITVNISVDDRLSILGNGLNSVPIDRAVYGDASNEYSAFLPYVPLADPGAFFRQVSATVRAT